MDQQAFNALENAGLSKGEIKVYLALSSLGKSTTGPIIKKSKISASKVYEILNKLIDKGLVSYSLDQKTKNFQVNQPLALIDYLERKEKEIQDSKQEIKRVIASLETKKFEDSEEVRIYKGFKGLKTGFQEAIKTILPTKDYLFFSTGYGDDLYLQQFFRDLALNLKEKKIKVKGIANKKEIKIFSEYYSKFGYSMKFIDLILPSDVTICGEYLIILVWDKDLPIIYAIKSRPLIDSYTNFFYQLWEK